jgi:hypothetical protein
MSAAGAALQLHEELKIDTEFWVSGGRMEGGGNTIMNSVGAMVNNIQGFTLKNINSATWPQFRDTVKQMHLMMQVRTYYESSLSNKYNQDVHKAECSWEQRRWQTEQVLN